MSTIVTRLNPAFIGKTPSPIKRKPRSKSGFRPLPFEAGRRSKSASPHWDVPASGGYFGGYETGLAMAQALLKSMRDYEGSEYPCSMLTLIVKSFMVRFEQEGGVAMENRRSSEWSDTFASFRGQRAGFFNTLSLWLVAAAKDLGPNLDRVAEIDLVRRANAGLGFDEMAYLNSLPEE